MTSSHGPKKDPELFSGGGVDEKSSGSFLAQRRVTALVLLLWLVTGCDRLSAKEPTWEQLVLRTEQLYRQEK